MDNLEKSTLEKILTPETNEKIKGYGDAYLHQLFNMLNNMDNDSSRQDSENVLNGIGNNVIDMDFDDVDEGYTFNMYYKYSNEESVFIGDGFLDAQSCEIQNLKEDKLKDAINKNIYNKTSEILNVPFEENEYEETIQIINPEDIVQNTAPKNVQTQYQEFSPYNIWKYFEDAIKKAKEQKIINNEQSVEDIIKQVTDSMDKININNINYSLVPRFINEKNIVVEIQDNENGGVYGNVHLNENELNYIKEGKRVDSKDFKYIPNKNLEKFNEIDNEEIAKLGRKRNNSKEVLEAKYFLNKNKLKEMYSQKKNLQDALKTAPENEAKIKKEISSLSKKIDKFKTANLEVAYKYSEEYFNNNINKKNKQNIEHNNKNVNIQDDQKEAPTDEFDINSEIDNPTIEQLDKEMENCLNKINLNIEELNEDGLNEKAKNEVYKNIDKYRNFYCLKIDLVKQSINETPFNEQNEFIQNETKENFIDANIALGAVKKTDELLNETNNRAKKGYIVDNDNLIGKLKKIDIDFEKKLLNHDIKKLRNLDLQYDSLIGNKIASSNAKTLFRNVVLSSLGLSFLRKDYNFSYITPRPEVKDYIEKLNVKRKILINDINAIENTSMLKEVNVIRQAHEQQLHITENRKITNKTIDKLDRIKEHLEKVDQKADVIRENSKKSLTNASKVKKQRINRVKNCSEQTLNNKAQTSDLQKQKQNTPKENNKKRNDEAR